MIDSQIGDLADDQAVQGANGTEKQEFESILPQCHNPARVALVAPPLSRATPSQNRVEEHFETIRPRRHNPARVKVIVPPPPRSTSSENWVGKRKHHPDSPPTLRKKMKGLVQPPIKGSSFGEPIYIVSPLLFFWSACRL